MTAKIIYGSDSEIAAAKLRHCLLMPAELACNGLVYLANSAVARKISVHHALSPDVAQGLGSPEPKILIAWHRYNYLCAHVMRHWPEACRPTLIMHDGLASRLLTHESSVWLGFNTFVFKRSAPLSPRQQISAYLKRAGGSILLLPDSGGPYGVVKLGVVEIAAACAAAVWPLTVLHAGTLELGKHLRHLLPLPGCQLEPRLGPPIPHDAVTQQRCQAALDELEKVEAQRLRELSVR